MLVLVPLSSSKKQGGVMLGLSCLHHQRTIFLAPKKLFALVLIKKDKKLFASTDKQ
jgi:hypothetical protein